MKKRISHLQSAAKITQNTPKLLDAEAVTGGVLLKKVFLKISQDSQESTYGVVSFQIK